MKRRRNGFGEFFHQLRQQVASAAPGLKEPATVHDELESHKAKADS